MITSFRAYERDGEVFVAWETAAEYDTTGYWIERSVDGTWVRINSELVWSELTGGPTVYELADAGVMSGSTHTWRVIEIEGSGTENIYGPYTVLVDGAAADFDAWADAIDWDGAASGRDDDPDADGLTNFEEFLAGTNPLNANSVLKVTSLNIVSYGVKICWTSVKGREYTVEYTEKLGGKWLPVKTGVVAVSDETRFVLPQAESGFFRIIVHAD